MVISRNDKFFESQNKNTCHRASEKPVSNTAEHIKDIVQPAISLGTLIAIESISNASTPTPHPDILLGSSEAPVDENYEASDPGMLR